MHKTFNLTLKASLGCSLLLLINNASANSIQFFGGLSFANPANLSMVKQQQVIAGDSWVGAKLFFTGTTRQQIASFFGQTYSGQANGFVGVTLPYFRYAVRLDPKWVVGFDISSPFATNLNWPRSSIARYAAVKTMLRTTDYSPNVSYNLTPEFAIGAGLDVLYGTAALNRVIYIPHIGDGEIRNSADNTAYGGHGGITYRIGKATKVDLAYYSKITFHLSGTSTYPHLPTSNHLTAELPMPPTWLLSIYQGLSLKWLVNAELSYTKWDVLKVIALHNTALGTPPPIVFNSQNTWRGTLGVQYKVFEQWALRGQVGYDGGPANYSYQSLALPSPPFYSVALGTHYQVTKPLGLDVYYGHAFMRKSPIHNVQTQSFGRLEMFANRVEARVTIDV